MRNTESFPYRLYLVISEDDCAGRDILRVTEQAILGGADIVQLREKSADEGYLLDLSIRMKALCGLYGIPLIINDHAGLAAHMQAAGVHVGNEDASPVFLRSQEAFRNRIIGYSVEATEQVYSDKALAADYLGISPVFRSATKTNTLTEWGLEGIAQIRSLTDKPLVAIGNMQLHNVRQVLQAGADCIAVVSAICGAADPQRAAADLKNEISK
ncbi:thiamine phosphate synthase [Rurimicrobium arvi]|uniref:Thiamine-phosphate synthase n=1 Tax=Rurimicrobium arvi TaxID=2049916 RepID=A0ABP8MSP8_9BACT